MSASLPGVGLPGVDPHAPAGLGKRLMTAVALSNPGTWYLKEISKRIDPFLVHATRGRLSSILVTPVVLLTVKGARTGKERTVALLYFSDGDGVVLMASNYGGTRHPAWYHNIRANPEVTLSGGGWSGRFVAHETEGEERERLWANAKQLTRAYTRYEGMTDGRTIPVLRLVPVA